MKSPLARELTDDECRQFRRDGVVCLRGIIAPEWIELAREGIEDQRSSPTPCATVVDKEGPYLLVDQMPAYNNPKLKRVAFESGAAEAFRQLIAAKRVHWIYLRRRACAPAASAEHDSRPARTYVDSLRRSPGFTSKPTMSNESRFAFDGQPIRNFPHAFPAC